MATDFPATVRLSESVFAYSVLLQQYSMLTGLPSDSIWAEAEFETHLDENGGVYVFAPPALIDDFVDYLNSDDLTAKIAEHEQRLNEEREEIQRMYFENTEPAGPSHADIIVDVDLNVKH